VTDVFEEVEEQIRQDRYVTFFKKYGWWLGGAFALLIAGMAAGLAWRHFSTEAARARSEAFVAIQELRAQGDLEGAKAALDAFEGRNSGVYRALTPMMEAAILVDQGDLRGAIEAFDRAAGAASDPIVRDSARLRAAYLVADTQDFAALEQRVAPLLEEPGPIRSMARQLMAIEAWEAGDLGRARDLVDEIALDLDAPEDVRQWAESIAPGVLGPRPDTPSPAEADATAEPAATPAEGTAK
jgi:hypothetical protein